jgi:hypothetical protein
MLRARRCAFPVEGLVPRIGPDDLIKSGGLGDSIWAGGLGESMRSGLVPGTELGDSIRSGLGPGTGGGESILPDLGRCANNMATPTGNDDGGLLDSFHERFGLKAHWRHVNPTKLGEHPPSEGGSFFFELFRKR